MCRSRWTALPGWSADKLSEALPAWRHSCRKILNLPPAKVAGTGCSAQLVTGMTPCEAIGALADGDTPGLRELSRNPFRRICRSHRSRDEPGLFTGYFEPILDAAREKIRSPQRADLWLCPRIT